MSENVLNQITSKIESLENSEVYKKAFQNLKKTTIT
jgi:hypothetical protein